MSVPGIADSYRLSRLSLGRCSAAARRPQRLQALDDLFGALPAIGRPLGEAAHDRFGQGRRAGRPFLGDRLGSFGDVGGQHLLRGQSGEWGLPGQQLVAHRAQGIDVGPMIDVRIGRGLFGRHVCRRPQRHAHRGKALPAGRFTHRLRYPEVHHQRVAARQHHVVRLDVTVDHAAAVGVGERIGHVAQQPGRLGYRQLALAIEPVAERFALDVGHDVEEEALGLARIEQRKDVGMLQLGGDLDFAQKAVGPQGRRQLRPQHLDRHFAEVLQILRQIDRGHAALTQLPLEAVVVGEGGGEVRVDGQWSMVNGRWSMVEGHWSLVDGPGS